VPTRHAGRFYIGGEWGEPPASPTLDVIDASPEQLYFTAAEAKAPDIARAVTAARAAFDEGPWPRLTHTERAGYLRAIANAMRERGQEFSAIWPREVGVVHTMASHVAASVADMFDLYANLAATHPFEETVMPTAGGEFGLLVREPVGVVGAIIPWNGPLGMIGAKLAPALLAGCTIGLKSSPEAPAEGYLFAEIAAAVGLPPGVVNVVTADREVSELLVRDPRVDKISFTGSTAAGRRIASLCGERIARVTLELGGKSAAVVLDDADLETAARSLAAAECMMTGQLCSSLTRIAVSRIRHGAPGEAIPAEFGRGVAGGRFDESAHMGPRAIRRQRFREEIFGPVLSVIAADDEEHAVAIANDTIYGLNASVFTEDVDRARAVAGRLRSGTVGHNAWRSDFGVSFGGYKQSGIGREGGTEGLLPYLETKYVVLDGRPSGHEG